MEIVCYYVIVGNIAGHVLYKEVRLWKRCWIG